MGKKSQIDIRIEELQAQILECEKGITVLRSVKNVRKPVRRPRVVKPPDEKRA